MKGTALIREKATTMSTYNLNGKEYPVTEVVKVTDEKGQAAGYMPVLDIPMVTDFKWQLNCLKDRLCNPQKYLTIGIDAEASVKKIKKWLDEHISSANAKERSEYDNLKRKYNFNN